MDAELRVPTISVIVTTWRRPEQLRLCLESIKRQLYKPCEVIVTEDDESGDGVYFAEDPMITHWVSHPRTMVNSKEIWDEPQTINAAVAAATGDIVQILQDDFIIPPDFLLWLARSIDHSSIIYPAREYTTHDRFTVADLDAMTRLTHLPDLDPRWQLLTANARRLRVEFTEWTMAEGVGWAFYRDAWMPIDPHFLGYGFGEQDWALRQMFRGYHLYVQPMMRAWLRNWPGVVHPTDAELEQMHAHQQYMREKWHDKIWEQNFIFPPLPFNIETRRKKIQSLG